jgi:putative iron-dependent peroxidase
MPVRHAQPSILAGQMACGESLSFDLHPRVDPVPALRRLAEEVDTDRAMLGVGEPLVRALDTTIPGLRSFPAISGAGFSIPSTQRALWIFLKAPDRGQLFDMAARLQWLIDDAFTLDDATETFTYAGGRDLSGYLDGTANPPPEEAASVALVSGEAGMEGSSFVGVQRWVHDLARFRSHSMHERDNMIGRRHIDNEEIDDAPESAHVKRTAQEVLGFMLRRSMPWAGQRACGLEFIAFAATLDPFERQLRHMAGLDDGIADALFTFSRPVAGSYYWCPPVQAGKLNLEKLGSALRW